MPNNGDRYELNHNGEIVVNDAALCKDLDRMLTNLFSQFGRRCNIENRGGSCRSVTISDNNGTEQTISVYRGTIRNESRNPYEKKMQLGAGVDPRTNDKHSTIILGIYVFDENAPLQDAVFVGFPIDDNIRYDTNPSLRGGIYVNQLLVQAKNNGFVYDREHNNVGFRPEFIFFYLDNFYSIHYGNRLVPELTVDATITEEETPPTIVGKNILLYGVPGCGKSHTIRTEYCSDETYMERVVFHPDYTYSDFVGQIMPKSDHGHISYDFTPGPFTRILKKAKDDPTHAYYLVVEEINRGNAPAIFGEIFQLLDRTTTGESEYGISNADIAKEVYEDPDFKVRIPANLFILATMNTADQNVFTLDTAFKRRWIMRSIENSFDDCDFAGTRICGTNITWRSFAEKMNNLIIELGAGNLSSEDHRLGAYFIQANELQNADAFSEKVLMYLWNDAFKYDHDAVFKSTYKTLEQLIKGFKEHYFEVFQETIAFPVIAPVVQSEGNSENAIVQDLAGGVE